MDSLITYWPYLLITLLLLLSGYLVGLTYGRRQGKALAENAIGQINQQLQIDHALLQQQLQTQQQHFQELRQQDQQHFKHQQKNQQQAFENLSHKIFNEKQQQNKLGLETILNPFKDQLEGLRKKVEDVHLHDAKDRAVLKTQISELYRLNQDITAEASALSKALRGDKKSQGNWGELVLETVLERF